VTAQEVSRRYWSIGNLKKKKAEGQLNSEAKLMSKVNHDTYGSWMAVVVACW
jgi:hypothetical protein